MAKPKSTPGLRFDGKQWVIDKIVGGKRLYERTGIGEKELDAAQKRLRELLQQAGEEQARRDQGVVLFAEAVQRYLKDFADKRSLQRDKDCLIHWVPEIGALPVDRIHMGTLSPVVEARRKAGVTSATVCRELAVIRRVLNLCARVWRHDATGRPWLSTAPPLLTMPDWEDAGKPFPLRWDEQEKFFAKLPDHLRVLADFGVNTGIREAMICGLRWDWEIKVPELGVSVFIVPGTRRRYASGDWPGTKTKTDYLVVLNRIARAIVEEQRGKHPEYVFLYRGEKLTRMHNTAWKKAWKNAGLPMEGIKRGPHNLRHTFAARLRALNIGRETRKALMNHRDGDIAELYASAQLAELLRAVETLADEAPNVTILRVVA